MPLDVEECRTAIWLTRGNITEASKLIKVTSSRLRTFINKSPYLSAEIKEAKDQLVDIAEDVVFDALTDDEDKGRKDTMARFVLTNLGRNRGYGTVANGMSIKNSAGGTIVVQWADGTNFGAGPDHQSDEGGDPNPSGQDRPTIDLTPNEAA